MRNVAELGLACFLAFIRVPHVVTCTSMLLWSKLQTLVLLLGHEHVHSGLFMVESKVRFGLGLSSATI